MSVVTTADVVALDLAFLRRFPDECTAEVSRDGEAQPCDRPAVAAGVDPEDERRPYPVCAHHARGRTLVPLRTLLEDQP